MNKRKQGLPSKLNKRVQKEVKKGLKSATGARSEKLEAVTPQSLLKPLPKRKARVEKSHLESMQHAMERKKAQKQKKASKRTSPKDAIVNSTPAHVHPEGGRWIKTIAKQNIVANKRITKKLSKKKM
jgi:hypothetical protein